MNHKQLSKLALALGAMVMAGGAMAADNATATVSAQVITPISISKDADMNLGNLVAGNGDVTLSPNGTRAASGTTLSTSGAGLTAAEFTVTGEGANTFSIAYTGSSSTLATTAEGTGTKTMPFAYITEVGDATAKTATDLNPTEGTLVEGTLKIFAGAKVTVAADQVPGAYTGSLKITVAYN